MLPAENTQMIQCCYCHTVQEPLYLTVQPIVRKRYSRNPQDTDTEAAADQDNPAVTANQSGDPTEADMEPEDPADDQEQ